MENVLERYEGQILLKVTVWSGQQAENVQNMSVTRNL